MRDAETKHAELDTSRDYNSYVADLARERDILEEKALNLDKVNQARIEEEKKALEEWETKTRRATEVYTEAKALKERYEATRQRHQELVEQLQAMADPPVRALGEDVEAAKEALQEAEEAAGSVATYHDAIARAKLNKVAEASWKAAEAACKAARESYVADIIEPLKADIAATLAAALAQQIWQALAGGAVALEKLLGDLGWTLGDSRRSLSSLSGGEAVLFTTALVLALARRYEGLRVLLIEADSLDEFNLAELLAALAGIPSGQLAACLVATTTDVSAADGWSCIQFERESDVDSEEEPS